MALTKVTKQGVGADAIDATKIADDAISEEHLDVTAVTGNAELSATAADDDVLLVFDTSAGVIKKIQKSNVSLSAPTFSSVSPTSLTTGDGTGNFTIVVTGTKFDATATFKLKTDGGTDIAMDSVTRNSATQLTGVVAKNKANLTNANEPFDIVITNGNSLTTTATDQINIDAQPVYTTAAGTLGTFSGGSAITTINIVATDPESAGAVTFEFQSGSLPAGLSSTTVNENGVSKFRITGTPTNPAANTTTNFTLRAVDAASNTTSRAFSITVNRTVTSTSFTSSGTFAVPSGTSTADVLVVAGGGGGGFANHGGGGGAGGLIFMPGFPLTPGGTVAVTVGCGGTSPHPQAPGSAGLNAGVNSTGTGPTPALHGGQGSDSVFGASPSPGLGQSTALTAKGGGGGFSSGYDGGATGGISGGSGGGVKSYPDFPSSGGAATQPTQPGNSGAYGFGNAGGTLTGADAGWDGAGGGGGAGAVGANSSPGAGSDGGAGGAGKAYTIADGTTPVYYSGGGGGSSPKCGYSGGGGTGGAGGQGGGGAGGPVTGASNPTQGVDGQANKGGGGGGSERSGPGTSQGATWGGAGGKGIVIVRY